MDNLAYFYSCQLESRIDTKGFLRILNRFVVDDEFSMLFQGTRLRWTRTLETVKKFGQKLFNNERMLI